jgi:phosphotransferase system enzyme I (PtsI)
VERLTDHLEAGDTVIVDGLEGIVIIRPDEELISAYRDRAARYARAETAMRSTRDEPAVTSDGAEVDLLANIELPAEAALALDYGAGGVGLYRTEFLCLDREAPPGEEEQAATYLSVIRAMAPRPVTFRTFDIGADKMPGGATSRERNPALGLRAIRLSFRNRGLFRTQLRALLRAARHGNARIMFPMISGVSELRQAKAMLEEAREEIGADAPDRVEIGCMIELPSAVFIADLLAGEVDFFSIGTNDLIQYSLAIDRSNDHVAYLYTPYHPSVLRAIKIVIDAGAAAGIPVSMCGEAASAPPMVPVLLGLGLTSFSIPPASIPTVKAVVRAVSMSDARELCGRLLAMDNDVEIEEAARQFVDDRMIPSFSDT